ncbi:MAG: hypothetical protein ACRDK7_11680 [Solirubrobacteraceae bacterium]
MRGPGPHVLGNFHIRAPAARRAWLWRDTGELASIPGQPQVDWMVAEGPRRQGHPSDLQVSHADILHDPDDTWLPTEEDYADLAAQHEAEWVQRARQAVVAAVDEAQAHRGELIAVDIDKVSASVAQDIGVSVTVIEEYAERWIIVDRLDTNRQPVEYRTAYALADAAFLASRTAISMRSSSGPRSSTAATSSTQAARMRGARSSDPYLILIERLLTIGVR